MLLIFKEPDYGTALTLGACLAGMLFACGLKRSVIYTLIALMLASSAFVPTAGMPDLVRLFAELRELTYDWPGAVMNSFDVQGHLVLGDKNVLARGFSGLRGQAEKRLARCQTEGDQDGAGNAGIASMVEQAIGERPVMVAEESWWMAAAGRQKSIGRKQWRMSASGPTAAPFTPPFRRWKMH